MHRILPFLLPSLLAHYVAAWNFYAYPLCAQKVVAGFPGYGACAVGDTACQCQVLEGDPGAWIKYMHDFCPCGKISPTIANANAYCEQGGISDVGSALQAAAQDVTNCFPDGASGSGSSANGVNKGTVMGWTAELAAGIAGAMLL